MDIEALKFLAMLRDEAEKGLLRCIKEDARIAENTCNYWRSQASGAD